MEKRFKLTGEELDARLKEHEEANVAIHKETRLLAVRILRHGLKFCNEAGTLLRLMTKLESKAELLQNPVYH